MNVKVGDLMVANVLTANPDETVGIIRKRILKKHIHCLPVVDSEQHPVGIISTSDLVALTHDLEAGLDELEKSDELLFGQVIERIGDGVGHQKVIELMSEQVVSAGPDETVSVAAAQMLRERIHRLPVVDGNRKLVGILSTTDILSEFVKFAHSSV